MSQSIDPANIIFILVRPVYLGNIGSVARLLKNFGFSQMRLVDAPRNYKDAEARKMAVGAFDILKECKTYPTLKEAIADLHLVVGTSAGQQRSLQLVPLKEIIGRVTTIAQTNKIAIVFGDERNGLSNDELNFCHALVRIETSDSFPSLNVAQAACVVAYELCQAGKVLSEVQITNQTDLPTGAANEALFGQLRELLETIQFHRRFNKRVVTNELRRLYFKASPTKREADLLKGILHKLSQAIEATHEGDESL